MDDPASAIGTVGDTREWFFSYYIQLLYYCGVTVKNLGIVGRSIHGQA